MNTFIRWRYYEKFILPAKKEDFSSKEQNKSLLRAG
jgi:hypothetical protein